MGEGPFEQELEPGLAITDQEYEDWQKHIDDIRLSEEIFEKIYQLKTMLEQHADGGEDFDSADSELYISDRRWKKAVRLLKASAFYNGRDAINPLDILLLQDCLWHSPESHHVVRNIINEFAVQKAFNQEIALESANEARAILDELHDEIIAQLCVTFSRETMMRKEWFKYDFSGARRYNVNHNPRMIKLVMLQQNPSVSEQETGDSRWVYVDGDELEKKIKTGQCDLYGFVNKNTHLCRLQFEVDAQHRLVIKDIANRSVLVGIAGADGISETQQQQWQSEAEKASNKIVDAEHNLKVSRSSFHGALPHHFINAELPASIEQSIAAASDAVTELKLVIDKSTFRISHLSEYFG